MFHELIKILRSGRLDQSVASEVHTMLGLCEQAVKEAGEVLFGAPLDEPQRQAFYARDREINGLQQRIRRELVSQLALSSTMQQARLLVISGLIKDIERIGDHAKNLLEAAAMLNGPLPSDPLCRELAELRAGVEQTMGQVRAVLDGCDRERAEELCQQGHELSDRCERLLRTLCASRQPASLAVPLALCARYYKRIQKHLMNLLSSVLMPLHKIDYFDVRE
ncbi:MAG: hypothetical protein OEZ06_05615 [Myxococcales bacterium]|nr:hypothetical protein [Myxococcales bacterium]